MQAKGRVLIIAGSDSGGGAGIQADIKTVTALGGFAMTAVTAITVQNTLGVSGVHPIPAAMVRDQIQAVMEDLGADAIKTGMLATPDLVETVAAALDRFAPGIPVVVDPVMVAKGGHPLLEEAAVETVRRLMIPRAALITPNAPEAAALTGLPVEDAEGLRRAGAALVALGAGAALMKGGHLEGAVLRDVLVMAQEATFFQGPRIETRSTHGTGCTLASAIAAGMAQGLDLPRAVARARTYLQGAIANAPGFGAGHGPLAHGWAIPPFEG